MKAFFLSSLLFLTPLIGEIPSKQQILYVAQSQNCKETLELYKTYKESLGRHDFEVLQEIASLWIEQSARDPKPEKQIMGIFAFGLAGLSAPYDLLEKAIDSSDANVQTAALGFIGQMQEDHADILLNKAMSSPFLYTRLEAAFLLAGRKSKTATGQIESLMYRLPPEIRYFFPEFFAIIGTSEAIHVLRHLMDDPFHPTKIGAILAAAKHGRDDLLPAMRAGVTHPNNAEQEACAAALGYLKDISSIKKLKKLQKHPSPLVQLSALKALYTLGENSAAEAIATEASKENLFAINLLSEIPGHENVLLPLVKSQNIQVRFNVTLALLKKKSSKCVLPLMDFLIKDSKDLGFQPQTSVGGSLQCWKVIPSLKEQAEKSFFDIQGITIALKHQLLAEAIELPEQDFLFIARSIFESKQNELIPVLVSLLENLKSKDSIDLLKKGSQKVGAPLIRAYCNLSLFKLQEQGPYLEAIRAFLKETRSQELIRFKAAVSWPMRMTDHYHISPEESSQLLIGSYEALTERQNLEGIDILLEALSEGSSHNRPVLAGILIHALQ
jgi:HEAT repeat protein